MIFFQWVEEMVNNFNQQYKETERERKAKRIRFEVSVLCDLIIKLEY